MKIGILGTSFHICDIAIREECSRACHKNLPLDRFPDIAIVPVVTCNRAEIYFSSEDLTDAHTKLLHAMREDMGTSFDPYLYSFFGVECFWHLACVTAGLDSSILGETEIQGQIKKAYERASLYRDLPSCLHYLFQKSLMLAKKARSDFPFYQSNISLPELLHEFIQRLAKGGHRRIFLIGNSEINRKIISFIARKTPHCLQLCTRAPHSVDEGASGVEVLGWDKLHLWKDADIVICGTHHNEFVIKREDAFCSTVKARWIFDLGMPRNVDPKMTFHPHINLFNIEQLAEVVKQKQQKLAIEKGICESWLRASVERYILSYQEKRRRGLACIVG